MKPDVTDSDTRAQLKAHYQLHSSGDALIICHCLDYIDSLRKKLAITKDGFAVGLRDEVFYPQSDGSVEVRNVWAYGGPYLACGDGNRLPVEVISCYASLERAHSAAQQAKDNDRIEVLIEARDEIRDNDAAWWHEENPAEAAELAELLAQQAKENGHED